MNLQKRKIYFVQEFLRLNNEGIISKFEQILYSEKKKLYSENFTPMSVTDFNKIIDNAENDVVSGRVKEIQELNKDIDSWT